MAAIHDIQPWIATPDKVTAAIRKIIEVGKPLNLILFGSYVQGNMNIDSDVDFLVVTCDDIQNPRKESIRIRRELRGIPMPMDILVVPKSQWELLKDQPGLIYREIRTKGKVVYES
ncbi:MAG: nucleotidyltransferase domain-containing protein [Candidatus Omnitrophota bacterium]